jgi:hypothetical protein
MRHVAENPPRWVRPTSIVAGLPPAPVSRLSHRRGHLRAGHDHMTSPNPRCRFLTQCHTYLGVTPSTGVLRLRACSFVPSTTCAKWLSQTMASAQALGWLAPRQREQTGSEPRPAPEIIAPATTSPWGHHRGHEPERSATASVLHGPCWHRFLSVSRHVVDAVPQGYEPQPAHITPSVPHHPAVPPQPDSHPDMTHTIAPSPRFFIYGDGIH